MSTANVTQTGGAATVAVTVSRGLQGVQGEVGPPGTIDYNELDNVPATFPPTAHDHVVSDITPVSGRHLIGRHASGSGDAQQVTVSGGIEFSGSGIQIANTAVTAAEYTAPTITVDAKGRITAAESVTYETPAGAAAQIAATALRSSVGFYDDFSRYANGYEIGHMVTTPLVSDGLTYRQSFNGDAPGSMFIENGALRCPVNSNNYLGFSFNTPDAELEMYFDIEVRRPPGSSQVGSGTGFTLTHKESAVVTDPGNINPSGGIHSNIALSGAMAISHFQQSTAVNQISTNTVGFLPANPSVGMRTLVKVWAKGDIYEVTAFGKTVRYQSTAFPGRIGSPKTFFYFQLNITPFAGQPDPTVRCYTVLHRMWGNAKGIKLDNTSEKTSAFDGNVPASYPNKIDIQPAAAFVGHAAGNRNETLRVGGAAVSGNKYTGGGAYIEGLIRATTIPGQDPGVVALVFPQTFNAVLQSPVSASLSTSFRGLHRISNLPTGWREECHYAGFLGANGNTKRFQIKEAGSVQFDSGDITQNGGVWELKTYRHSLTGISEAFIFDFWTEQTGRKMAYVPVNRGGTFTTFNLHVQGTALGDVTMTTVRTTVVPATAS